MISPTSLLPKPQHWPLPMGRFGKTPTGANLYRIVFAPSVKMLVGGKWPDGRAEYRVRPAYRHVGNEWVLERWLSAQEFTGMTEAQYQIRYRDPSTGLLTCGPYPVSGAYFMCMDAPIKPEALDSVEKIIAGIEFSRKHRSADRYRKNAELIQEDLRQQEAAQDSELLAKIQEARPAFGVRPSNIGGMIHSTKSKNIVIPAEATGLPVGNNKFVQLKGE